MTEPQKPHIFLFTGTDSFSIAEKLSFWKKEFQKKYGVGTSLAIDCESTRTPEDVIRELHAAFQMQTLFASAKIVMIKNIFSKTALANTVREFMEQRIKNIPQSDFVVFTSEKQDKKSGLSKTISELEKTGKAKSDTFDIPRGAVLRKWIASRFEHAGANVHQHTLEYFVQAFDSQKGFTRRDEKPLYDLWGIAHDIEKLSAYARGRAVTKEDVDLFIPRSQEGHIFDLTDALAARNAKHALQLAHTLVSGSQSQIKGSCIYLAALLIGQFRGLFLVKKLSDAGKSEQQIADVLDWDPKRVWVNKKKTGTQTADQLQRTLRSLIEYDYSLKTSSAHPLAALDLLICKATGK